MDLIFLLEKSGGVFHEVRERPFEVRSFRKTQELPLSFFSESHEQHRVLVLAAQLCVVRFSQPLLSFHFLQVDVTIESDLPSSPRHGGRSWLRHVVVRRMEGHIVLLLGGLEGNFTFESSVAK